MIYFLSLSNAIFKVILSQLMLNKRILPLVSKRFKISLYFLLFCLLILRSPALEAPLRFQQHICVMVITHIWTMYLVMRKTFSTLHLMLPECLAAGLSFLCHPEITWAPSLGTHYTDVFSGGFFVGANRKQNCAQEERAQIWTKT